MEVKEIMKKSVIKIQKGTSLKEAAQLLVKHNISGAPVVTKTGKVIGIISEKNIFRALYPNYEEFYIDLGIIAKPTQLVDRLKKIVNKKVDNYMVKEIVSVKEDDSVIKAGGIMMARGIHRVLVENKDGKLIGIVSRRDIYPEVFKKLLKI